MNNANTERVLGTYISMNTFICVCIITEKYFYLIFIHIQPDLKRHLWTVVHLFERLESLGIMGTRLRLLKPLGHHGAIVGRGLTGALEWKLIRILSLHDKFYSIFLPTVLWALKVPSGTPCASNGLHFFLIHVLEYSNRKKIFQ